MASGYEGGKRDKRHRRQKGEGKTRREMYTTSTGQVKYRSKGHHGGGGGASPKTLTKRRVMRAKARAIKEEHYRTGNLKWQRRKRAEGE